MANSSDFWESFGKRFGRPDLGQSEPEGFGAAGSMFDRLKGAPLWKVTVLGGAAVMAVGSALFSLLLAASALFLLALLFGALLGTPRAQSAPVVPQEPPPTYH